MNNCSHSDEVLSVDLNILVSTIFCFVLGQFLIGIPKSDVYVSDLLSLIVLLVPTLILSIVYFLPEGYKVSVF